MFILFLQRFLQIIKITVIIKSSPSTIAKTITAANAPSIVDANSAPIIAATINVPIIHTMPIPGCETYNAEFFESRGMSISCKNTTDIKNAVISLLDDKNKVENIIKAQKQNIDKNACSKICEFIIDEIRKYSK